MKQIKAALLAVVVTLAGGLALIIATVAFVALLFALVILPFPWNLLLLCALGFVAGYFID